MSQLPYRFTRGARCSEKSWPFVGVCYLSRLGRDGVSMLCSVTAFPVQLGRGVCGRLFILLSSQPELFGVQE